jgi:hypothetical protein
MEAVMPVMDIIRSKPMAAACRQAGRQAGSHKQLPVQIKLTAPTGAIGGDLVDRSTRRNTPVPRELCPPRHMQHGTATHMPVLMTGE